MALYIDGKKVVNSLVIDGVTWGEINFQPVAYSGQTHYFQYNRSFTLVNDYELSSYIGGQYDMVGVMSLPLPDITATDYILVKYQLQGLSYTSYDYFATAFFSDAAKTSVGAYQDNYGYTQLVQETLAQGVAGGTYFCLIKSPGANKYFNIQFGSSGFKGIKLFIGHPNL